MATTQDLARFSSKTLQFIEKASRQKREDWLDRNRDEYEKVLLFPLQRMALHLKKSLSGSATGYHFPQKGLARLKRSANRAQEYGSHFKDWISYSAARPRVSRFDHNPNLFFLLQPGDPDGDEVLLAGGLYMPSSRQLRSIRETIAENAEPFQKLFGSKSFSAKFTSGFSDERIATRPPRGFDPNHPQMNWLKLQAFFVWKSYSKKEFNSDSFFDLIAADGAQILRLNQLLDQALEGRLRVVEPKSADMPVRLTSKLEEIQAPRRKMDF